MKKSLLSALILLIVAGTLGFAPNALADEDQISGTEVTTADSDDMEAGNVQNINQYVADKTASNIGGPPSPAPEIGKGYGELMIWVMKLFAWLVGVAAITLQNAVHYTVVSMGDFIGQLSAIGVTWKILRDIGNILLIFGFLAIGINTIINQNIYGWGKSQLPKLILAAVFLNFSLLASEAVIDVGNLFATQFYAQINGGSLPGATEGDIRTAIDREGISNKIMAQVGLQTIYGDARTNKEVFKGTNSLLVGFMGIILFIVTAFVMFSLAFILIARFVVLIFLIIASPIGFAGLAVPNLASLATRWWNELFKQTITAPALLLLLYIALAIITDEKFLSGFGIANNGRAFLGFIEKGDMMGFGATILAFIVAMGLLLVVTLAAKSMSAAGADMAMKWAGAASFGLSAYGASALTGGTAFALRRGVVQRLNPTSRWGRRIQYATSRGLRNIEGVRMDTRRLPGAQSALNVVGAGATATPIGMSTVARGKQLGNWIRTGGQEANRQMDQETRINRLGAALGRGDRAEALRLMRTVTDDELHSRRVENLLTTNPLAVQVLTNHQVTVLPDNVLTNANVYQNLSTTQLEAYRQAGNGAPRNAAMEAHLRVNQYDAAYLAMRNPGDQAAIRTFWNL